jgi:hypothetical protein
MKVHEYNEMMRWLTRPKQDPSIKQLAASLPYGTSGTYGAPEETPMPNWRDLIREEGVQVGPQVKEGGRVYDTRKYFKPGGLVEPGVTHYGKFTEAEKAANVQAYLEKSGDTLEKFNTYDLSKQSKIKNKIITGVGSGKYTERRTGKILSGDERWKLWTDKEPLFEEYVQTQMKKPTPDMKKVMKKYHLTADSSPKEFFSKMTDEYAEANKARRLTEAGTPTKSLIARQSYENFFQYGKKTTRHAFYDTFLPQRGTISVKEFVDQVPAMKGYKDANSEFTKLMNESSPNAEATLKRLDKGSEAFIRKRSKIKQGKDFIKALEAAGIEMVETRSPEYIERRIREGRPMEMSARRIKNPTLEQITTFSDSDYFKDTYRLDQNYKNKISALSIKDPQYKVGGYGTHQTNLKQLQRVLNNKISSMTNSQLRAWVENNPSLKRMVEFDFDILKGEIDRIPLEKMSDSLLRERVRIERDHIRGRSTVGYDKATNKILDGIDVEFPKNYQLQPKAINHVTKGNIERWVAQHSNETAKIKKLDDFFKSIDSSYWDINAKKYRGAPVKEISAYTKHLGIDMEQLLKSEEVFPAGHRDPITGKMRAGERIVERPNLLAKITKANEKIAKLIAQGPEGIKFLNKQATAQTMWKIIGDKGGKICKGKFQGGGGVACGLKFATEDPAGYMAKVKQNKEALNAFKVASTGKDTSKVLKAARWVMRDLSNPVGWIGSELIISGGITAAMLGEGYTTREAIDSGIAWFLPKSVLKAELHKIRDMAEKEGVDFETLMPFLELESISEEYDKHKIAHLKNTDPLYAWKPEQLEYFSSKWFGKPTSKLSRKENMRGTSEVEDFVNSLKMPSASGRGGEFYRKQAIDSSVLGMGTANKKYSDLLRKIQKPFEKDDLRYALPYSQLDELRNVADMTQTEKAKEKKLAALKGEYDKRLHYTRGQGEQISFQDWVHQRGKGDLFFNEFQRGPDRREMLTWSLFNDTGVDPYKMPFPEKAPIDFSAAPYEEGGRVGFKLGGIDKGRRAFMKWLAGITGAGIAAGTGILKFGKTIGTGKTVIKAGDHILQGTSGMPDWFIPLVNRIVKEGDDVTKKLGTVEREIVHTKKIGTGRYGRSNEEVTVYQNLDTGNVRVEYGGPVMDKKGNVIRASNDPEVVHLEYKAPEEITSGKHRGQKTKSEFSAAEAEPEVVNWDGDIEWSGINEVNKVDDLITDTSKLKQFATKKKPTMGEIVESSKKKKYQKKLQEDTMEQIDYIEKKRGPFQDPQSIDDILEQGKAEGVFDPKGYDTHREWKGQNLPKEYNEKVIKEYMEKTKKASGGRVDYDNYLPDIEDID